LAWQEVSYVDKVRKAMFSEKGFTLVEMMVVLIIVAILIALGIWAYIGNVWISKLTKANDDITTIQAALDSYYSTNQTYPSNQTMLSSAGISSFEVNAGTTSNPNNAPYGYSGGGSSYTVNMHATGNGEYMQGTGASGISTPATAIAGTATTLP
jgi:general secretion pathway protein G